MNLKDYITPRHIGAMCQGARVTDRSCRSPYLTEIFTAWYSGNPYEKFVFLTARRGRSPGLLDDGDLQRGLAQLLWFKRCVSRSPRCSCSRW